VNAWLSAARFALVMCALLAALSLPGSALFTLETVVVEGAHTLSPEEVVEASGLEPGTVSLFRVPAGEVEERLARHPRIAAARVRPRPPHTIVIEVAERVAAAAVPLQAGYAVVDGGGVVIEVTPARPALPLVSGRGERLPWAAPGHLIPSAAAREAVRVLPLLPPPLRGRVAHLQVTATREVVLYTLEGVEIRAGPVAGVEERLAVAPEVLQRVRAEGLALAYVDLRVPDTVILGPRQPEPAP